MAEFGRILPETTSPESRSYQPAAPRASQQAPHSKRHFLPPTSRVHPRQLPVSQPPNRRHGDIPQTTKLVAGTACGAKRGASGINRKNSPSKTADEFPLGNQGLQAGAKGGNSRARRVPYPRVAPPTPPPQTSPRRRIRTPSPLSKEPAPPTPPPETETASRFPREQTTATAPAP